MPKLLEFVNLYLATCGWCVNDAIKAFCRDNGINIYYVLRAVESEEWDSNVEYVAFSDAEISKAESVEHLKEMILDRARTYERLAETYKSKDEFSRFLA